LVVAGADHVRRRTVDFGQSINVTTLTVLGF
jgi:hypothetical protein